jgi:WhiB family transcriptional regulator, redox-sensing transcriptional regulator
MKPVPKDIAWQYVAECKTADQELFLLPDSMRTPEQEAEAKAYCQKCDVVSHCLRYALRHNAPGIWGNTTEAERQQLQPV